jgi:hypothetical protein
VSQDATVLTITDEDLMCRTHEDFRKDHEIVQDRGVSGWWALDPAHKVQADWRFRGGSKLRGGGLSLVGFKYVRQTLDIRMCIVFNSF